jgi:predicted nucleic acid-binding protein
MKALVDTNVVLDVLLNQIPFSVNSKAIFDLAEDKRITGYISASSITDIFYIANKKIKDREIVYQAIETLDALFLIVPVTKSTITEALALRWKDFEDAVQFIVAKENGIEYIITRNEADYKTSDIPCKSPMDFITSTHTDPNTKEQ